MNVDARAAHGDRDAAGVERAAMARSVHSDGESAGDREAAARQVSRESRGVLPTGGRWVARSDHRKLRTQQEVGRAAHIQAERRIADLRKERRITLLAPMHERAAGAFEAAELPAQIVPAVRLAPRG